MTYSVDIICILQFLRRLTYSKYMSGYLSGYICKYECVFGIWLNLAGYVFGTVGERLSVLGVFSCHVTVNVGEYTLRIFIFVPFPDSLSSVCLGSSWATVRGQETKPWIRFAEVIEFNPWFLASSSPDSRHHFHTRCLAVFGRHGDLGTANKQKHLRQTKYDGVRKDKINWYLYISEKVNLTGGCKEQRERVRLIV